MTKKEKLFLLIFALSVLSIFVSFTLKLAGINLYGINESYDFSFTFVPIRVEFIINGIISIIQFYLIVGCITRYQPKPLLIKIIPYLPLTFLLYFLPEQLFFPLCLLILLATCTSINPKFSTLILFIVNIFLISVLQIVLIWLKLDVVTISPIFPDFMKLLLLHFDEFIILGFLYFVNRKWGEKFAKLVIFWRNGQ